MNKATDSNQNSWKGWLVVAGVVVVLAVGVIMNILEQNPHLRPAAKIQSPNSKTLSEPNQENPYGEYDERGYIGALHESGGFEDISREDLVQIGLVTCEEFDAGETRDDYYRGATAAGTPADIFVPLVFHSVRYLCPEHEAVLDE